MCLPLSPSWEKLVYGENLVHLIQNKEIKENYVIPFFSEILTLALNPYGKDDINEKLEEIINNSSIVPYIEIDNIPYFFYHIAETYKDLTSELLVLGIAYVKKVLDVSISDLTVEI